MTRDDPTVSRTPKRLAALLGIVVPPLLTLAVLIVGIELLLWWRGTPEFIIPRPSAIARAASAEWRDLLAKLWQTAVAALMGFALSAVGGVAIAIVLGSSRWIRRALSPYTLFFQTVPIVAIAPMLVIWFDAGRKSVTICALVVSIFPVIANTLAGLLSTDPALLDLFKLYGARRIATLWKLRLPWAIPNILTGMRIAAGLSVIGAIVGEFAAGKLDDAGAGLGIMILEQIRQGNTAIVFAAVIASSLLGLGLLSAIRLASYVLLRRWHASERS